MRQELLTTLDSYNKSALEYEASIAQLTNYDTTYEYFTSILNPGDRVIDLGCGPANIALKLKTKLPKLKITGVDLSNTMIEISKRKMPDDLFFVDDAVSFRPEEFQNGAVIGFLLPYLNLLEIEALIKNTNEFLVRNGKLYLSFMAGNSHGYESPSFNQKVQLYIFYHEKKAILNLLHRTFRGLVIQFS